MRSDLTTKDKVCCTLNSMGLGPVTRVLADGNQMAILVLDDWAGEVIRAYYMNNNTVLGDEDPCNSPEEAAQELIKRLVDDTIRDSIKRLSGLNMSTVEAWVAGNPTRLIVRKTWDAATFGDNFK